MSAQAQKQRLRHQDSRSAGAGFASTCSVFAAALLAGLAGCGERAATTTPAATADAQVVIVPRTPELATFSCMERCHAARASNPTQRTLREFHASREIHHGPVIHWCEFCHRMDNLDQLKLIDGTNVSFNEEHRLCAQCHPARVRDWEHGIHGLQTGSWSGERRRRECGVCHDPHDPHRPVFNSLPPPARDRSFPEGASHHE